MDGRAGAFRLFVLGTALVTAAALVLTQTAWKPGLPETSPAPPGPGPGPVPPTETIASPSPPASPAPGDTAGPVEIVAVRSSAEAPSVERSGGQFDTYGAELAADGDPSTAWCVEGDGVGEFLEVAFGFPTAVTEVGIVPGYDKIDPETGDDRFYENRRILEAFFGFDEGQVLHHAWDDDERVRELQLLELPEPITTEYVRIEPAVTTEPSRPDRDYTCISEVVVLGISS